MVTDLPTDTFIILAFDLALPNWPAAGKRDALDRRQQSDGSSSIVGVDLSQATGIDLPGGVSQDNCDESTALLLQNGKIVSSDGSVGKGFGDAHAEMSITIATNAVNRTLSFEDGILQWSTSDVGLANFFLCSGTLFAGFPLTPANDCIPLRIGGIAGSACRDRVARTRAVNAAFTDPASTSLMFSTIPSGTNSVTLSSPTTTTSTTDPPENTVASQTTISPENGSAPPTTAANASDHSSSPTRTPFLLSRKGV